MAQTAWPASRWRFPYSLGDMAADAVGAFLDAISVIRAHIVGASMGGMIAQLVAANHQGRDQKPPSRSCRLHRPAPICRRQTPEAMAPR